jgi:1-pyrroline-5-carboxylate dehydrogenase
MSPAAFNGRRQVTPPVNEPIRSYAPGTPERASIKATLGRMASETIDIPLVIGGREVRTGETAPVVMPHAHGHVLGMHHSARPREVEQAIEAALKAHCEWSAWAFEDRAAVLLKAAELLRTSWRDIINGATMLGQSKTVFQAEIDSACEIIDFFRFNAHYAQELLSEQPISDSTMWNQLEYRALEGFVYVVTPFNFTSIAANLPTAPALMGNTIVWKPAEKAMFAAHYLMKLFEEAGFPPGVINLVSGDPAEISNVALSHRDLAGVHFTGSTTVFNSIWTTVGTSVSSYRSYPRLVGETGGKDFILAHPSADVDALAVAVVRGGFEFQGQKCSAASRVYVPRSIWPAVRNRIAGMMESITMGDVRNFQHFMGAVIDQRAFDKITSYIEFARQHATIVKGGEADASEGYFIRPTLIQTDDPGFKTLREEIFGPVVSTYVYDDARWSETLRLVDQTSPYALTGAVFAQDRSAVVEATSALRYSAGNFYVNDKPTGAVVGQQPFGGARASGTNDKAGSKLNLVRWVSARTLKENFNPPHDYRYPFMSAD